MEIMHGLNFKLVYTDWYIQHGQRKPFGNGMHIAIRDYLSDCIKKDLRFDWHAELQKDAEEKVIKFDHSELVNYFSRNFSKNIISSNQIIDDNFIYIYPIEIRETLNALNKLNKFKLNDIEYEYYFKDIIPEDILKHLKTGKVKILINQIHDPLYDDNNIQLFEKQMNKLGVNSSSIIFLGGSNFSEYYEKYPNSKVKIYNGHLFIKGFVDEIKEFPCIGNLGYECKLVDETDLDINKIRPYKFLCNNRTMEKPHRILAAYLALKYDLLKDGMFSFIQKLDYEKIKDIFDKTYQNIDDDIIKKLSELLPYELDTHELSIFKKRNFGVKNNKIDWYSDCYINLVTETFFGHNVFLSEKIFKPIGNLQPFIVFGDYLTLAELRKLGFKTFEPFIDESYDLEKDQKKRAILIEKEIEKLNNLSIEEIHNWYYSIKDILIYNKTHLYTFEKYECFEQIFEKIKLDYQQKNEISCSLQEIKFL
jgi:hypothetical protein